MLDKNYTPADHEAAIYQKWEKSGVFSPDDIEAQAYTIVLPPPNVTGSLHVGHALNCSLQDLLIRYQRMNGRAALWLPGMDHAGIATQMVVERQLAEAGKPGRQAMGRDEFVQTVWDWKQESGGMITSQLRRLGTSLDWSRERFTMDSGLSRAVLQVFVTLYQQGLIYRDLKLVNWDPVLQTAISDLEVKPVETQGKLYHIRYPLIDPETGKERDEAIIVATTRPETLLGDTAVAVHPEDPRYQSMIGQFCSLPLTGRQIPIIADDFANPEEGSGAVKITPAHDFGDFEVGRRHDLEMINIFTASATLNENVPDAYQGLDRYAARKQILSDLENAGLLVQSESITHTVPYGERSQVPIEPYLTWQWYVDAKTLAGPAIEAVREGRTRFEPANWAKTYFNWMEDIQPWCISRQLWWGHQIPAWYGPDDTIFVAMTEEEAYAQAVSHYQENRPELISELAKGTGLKRDPDVLDTWFSSALWPFSTLGWPDKTADFEKYYPTDFLITGFDIIFFWVARMMMMGIHFTGKEPFHTVYIHALVLDAKGQKMSKSKGNVIDPLTMVDDYGADALRMSLISQAAAGRNVRISNKRVEGYRNFITKIWNAARFAEMNGITIIDEKPLLESPLSLWIDVELSRTIQAIDTAITHYRFADAAHHLYHFVWGTFCDWYLEFIKPLLQESESSGESDNSRPTDNTRDMAGWVLGQILHILHPFCPFVSEVLYQYFKGKEASLVRAPWPLDSITTEEEAGEEAWQEIDALRRLIVALRNARASLNIPGSVRPKLIIPPDAPASFTARLMNQHIAIKRMGRVEDILLNDSAADKTAIGDLSQVATLVVDGVNLVIPLVGIIDVAQERSRLSSALKKVEEEAGKLQSRLDNPSFREKAPEDVIETLTQRLEETQTRAAGFQSALDLLKI